MSLRPLKDNTLGEADIIALIGPPGSGKSTFIDIATKQDGKSVGHNLQPYTTDVRAVKVRHPHRGHPVIFIDTPAFDNTSNSDSEVLMLIADWLKQTCEGDVKLTGIIYLHRISDNRLTQGGSPLKNHQIFGELCGDDATRNVILATTMWVTPEKDPENKQLRHENDLRDKYWKKMVDCGSTMTRFLRTYDSAWTIVDLVSIINPPDSLVLREELVELKNTINKTQTAITLYDTLQTALTNQKDAVKKLRKEAEKQDNVELLRELTSHCAEIEGTLCATLAQMRGLNIPVGRRILSLFSLKQI